MNKFLSLLFVLPILSIIGADLFNSYGLNYLLLLLIIMIASTLIMVIFIDTIPKKYYPISLFLVALALLYHRSLISPYLVGWDIQLEYFVSNAVLTDSYWNATFPITLNSMLFLSIQLPILSEILGVNLIYLYKVLAPILFSLVPVFLYYVYARLYSKKIAYCSAFVFISFYPFFTEMTSLVRQQIALLIFAILLLIITSKTLCRNKKIFLTLVFSLLLIFNHYLIFYIFLFLCTFVIVDNKLKLFSHYIWPYLAILTTSFIWYSYTSQGLVFRSALNFQQLMQSTFFSELFSITARDPSIGYALGQLPTLSVFRYFTAFYQYCVIMLLLIGFLYLIISHKFKNNEIKKFTIGSFLLLVSAVIIPYFSSTNMERLFLIALMLLAPCCIYGGIFLLNLFKPIFTRCKKIDNLKIIAILLLVPYLLLNTGFIYEIANDSPSSISLDPNMDYVRYNNREYSGAQWLLYFKQSLPIFADDYRYPLLRSIEWFTDYQLSNHPLPPPSYMFLGTFNINTHQILIYDENSRIYVSYDSYCDSRSLVYTNYGSKIFY